MVKQTRYILSVVVPLYNERQGVESFHQSLLKVLHYVAVPTEIIYCDDGSTDETRQIVQRWCRDNPNVKLISFSRNFGKESALTAGLIQATGEAVITMDGDGQHPPELIPNFLQAWRQGAQVVIGQRTNNSGPGVVRYLGTKLFYLLFRNVAHHQRVAGSTDYRLIDAAVRDAFISLPETDRITRGLIDWLGFKRVYIEFKSSDRTAGASGFSNKMLLKLAMNSIVSLTAVPLYIFGCLGLLITAGSLLLGMAVFVEQLVLGDPWHWRFTGTAMLSILLLFLVGVVLLSQGLISLYVAAVHNQSKQRPLFIIDYGQSAGINKARHD